MITLDSRTDRDRFGSQHSIRSALSNEKQLIILSGIVLVDYKGPAEHVGEATQFNWHREQFGFTIDFDSALPPDKWFQIEQSAPIVSLNAFEVQVPPDAGFFGGGWYHYPGIAVDSFWLDFSTGGFRDLMLRGDVAIKYPGSQLFRVAYHITLIGMLVDPHSSIG
jgi:hypothetical protein